MPVHAVGLILKPHAGASPRTCQAAAAPFGPSKTPVYRGVIAYYAARALPSAATAGAWFDALTGEWKRDLRERRLSAKYGFEVQRIGDPKSPLPGRPMASPARR